MVYVNQYPFLFTHVIPLYLLMLDLNTTKIVEAYLFFCFLVLLSLSALVYCPFGLLQFICTSETAKAHRK